MLRDISPIVGLVRIKGASSEMDFTILRRIERLPFGLVLATKWIQTIEAEIPRRMLRLSSQMKMILCDYQAEWPTKNAGPECKIFNIHKRCYHPDHPTLPVITISPCFPYPI